MILIILRIFFAITLLFNAAVLQAWQTNFLLGVSGAAAWQKQTALVTLAYTGLPILPGAGFGQPYREKYFVPGGLAGIQWQAQGWRLGLEASLEYEHLLNSHFYFSDQVSLVTWQATLTQAAAPVYGINGRFAYEVTPYLIPYMQLGLAARKDLLKVTLNTVLGPFVLQNTQENTAWQSRYLAGFGFEIPLKILTCPVLRIEYNYQCYFSNDGISVNGAIPQAPLDPAFELHIHPRIHTGKAAIVWYFGRRPAWERKV